MVKTVSGGEKKVVVVGSEAVGRVVERERGRKPGGMG